MVGVLSAGLHRDGRIDQELLSAHACLAPELQGGHRRDPLLPVIEVHGD